ncbi:MAG: outer membrane lipoprotein carrier protein LolA [Gemmatimonadota bacterium]
MNRIGLSVAVLLAPLALGAQVVPGAETAAQVVSRASRVYKQLSGMQAEFRQHIEDPMVGNLDSKGKLSQTGKNRFAMRFSDPANEAIVIDGTKLWIYTPSTSPGQVLRYPAPSSTTYGVNLMDWFLDNPLDRYRLTYVSNELLNGRRADVVLLEPTARDLPFRRATLWFDREDGLPRRFEIDERQGQKRTILLTNLRQNASVPPSEFVFRVPDGVRVIDQ